MAYEFRSIKLHKSLIEKEDLILYCRHQAMKHGTCGIWFKRQTSSTPFWAVL